VKKQLVIFQRKNVYQNETSNLLGQLDIVICISRMRNRTLTNREKNCRQGRFGAEARNLEVVKGFRSQGVHNILCATRKFVIKLSIKIKSAYMSPCRYGNDINKTIHFEKNCKNVRRKLRCFSSVYSSRVKKIL
jgi:hypothetical protein